MTHLTDELVAQAIEQVLGDESGWKSNGQRAEGWSITIASRNSIFREQIERLRLRLNTIERNLGGTDSLAYWRLRFYNGYLELRYLLSDYSGMEEMFPEGLLLPVYDDEDGDAVDGRLSFVAYMMRIAKGDLDTDDMEIYDFVRDFCGRHKDGHYLFDGQKTYHRIRSYLWRGTNHYGMAILDRIVKTYKAYCEEQGLKCENVKTTI